MKISTILLKMIYYARNYYWKFFRQNTTGIRVMATQKNKVLLVRHTYKNPDVWDFPGGGIKKKESFENAARREAFEEAGIKFKKLVLLRDYLDYREGRKDRVIVYSGEIQHLYVSNSIEIIEKSFFDVDTPPQNIDFECHKNIKIFLEK